MLLNPARKRDLLSDFRTRGRRQLDFGQVRLDAQNASASGRRADVNQEELALDQLPHLGLLLVLRLDSQQSAQQEQTDLQLCTMLNKSISTLSRHERTGEDLG